MSTRVFTVGLVSLIEILLTGANGVKPLFLFSREPQLWAREPENLTWSIPRPHDEPYCICISSPPISLSLFAIRLVAAVIAHVLPILSPSPPLFPEGSGNAAARCCLDRAGRADTATRSKQIFLLQLPRERVPGSRWVPELTLDWSVQPRGHEKPRTDSGNLPRACLLMLCASDQRVDSSWLNGVVSVQD